MNTSYFRAGEQTTYARYLVAAAPVTLTEENGELIVRGPYDAMKSVYPKLKTRGFRYNPSDKSWRIPANKLTDVQRKNIDKLIAPAAPDHTPPAAHSTPPSHPTPPAAPVDPAEPFEALIHRAKHLVLVGGITIRVTSIGFDIVGDTYPIRDEIRNAGGKWREPIWEIFFQKTTPQQVEKLFDFLVQRSNKLAIRRSLVENEVGSNSKHWPKIRVNLNVREGYLFFTGDTKPFLNEFRALKAFFSGASGWKLATYYVDIADLKNLLETLDKAEAKAEVDVVKPDQSHGSKRTNNRADYCHRCGVLVGIGEGYATQVFDDDDEKWRWVVEHKSTDECQRYLEERRVRAEKARTKDQARRNLREMAAKPAHYIPGQNDPKGELKYVTKTSLLLHGGGEWVVIEPDGHHFWYVINNGADGDDWSRNNIVTHGAGAIGYRLPLTEEAKVLIEVAAEP